MKKATIENKGIYNDGLSVVLRMLCTVVRHISYGRFSLLGRGQATFIVLALLLLSGSVCAQNTYFRTEAGVPYIPVLATPPTPTSVGAFYTNSTDKLTYWYDGTKWIPIDLGVVVDINLTSNTVLYKTQTITPEIRYIYTGNNTASTCPVTSSTYTWYRADDATGTNKIVISTGTGTPSSYTVVAADVNKYIGLGVTPTTPCNIASFESVSWKFVSALTPSVARVDVSGLTGTSALATNLLAATFSGYTCMPVLIPGDAGASSTYRWYYANDASGTGKTAISGKTASTYTVSFSDGYAAGKYLAVGVTAVASNGEVGTEKISTWYATSALVPAYDVVNLVGLTSGNAKNATTIAALKGTFSITPAMIGAEGIPTYQWYYATSSTGTGKTAITGQTSSTHTVNIGGSYGYVNDTYYLAAGVKPVATTGETGTEVLSSWVQLQVDKAADGSTAVNELTSSSGRVWMDRNLGATQAATSSTDYLAYGSLYQWCRASDGHEKITWTSATTGTPVNGTTATLSTSTTPGHSFFITNSSASSDWLASQQSDGSLWWNGTAVGANNPCPAGFHVPTYAEWNVELSYITSAATAYSVLKLPMSGYRWTNDGTVNMVGTRGEYWSSTVTGINSWRLLYYTSSFNGMGQCNRGEGNAVRCIKDLDAPQAQSVSISGTSMLGSAVTGVYTYVAPQTTGLAEGTSTYKWYVATDGIGTGKTAISGATARNYTHASPVVAGQYIAFGVTPVSADGKTGTEVLSTWVNVQSSPTVTSPDGTLVVDLLSSSGRIWMDRNLGASRQATSPTDYLAYGSLYQWCRAADGHERINWTSATTGTGVYGTTSTLSTSTTPGHSKFIINPNSPYDWLSTQQTDGSLWWNGTVAGVNSPCPMGYHVPTYVEWSAELTAGITNATTAYSKLKLTIAGIRYYHDASFGSATTYGRYWGSTGSGSSAYYLGFDASTSIVSNDSHRAHAMSIRCVKDLNTTPVVDIVSPSGRTWMDRNIGATQAATSSTDYLAYGSMFQWCRAADGHEKITWTSSTTGTPVNGTTTTLSTTATPGHSLFIITNSSPNDWLSTQQSDGSLWWNGTVAGGNTPCPAGYHVPTYAEWNAELSYITSAATAYSVLKLIMSGYRAQNSGIVYVAGGRGEYWSSTVNGANSWRLLYYSSSFSGLTGDCIRTEGNGVRCIKNLEVPQAQSVSISGTSAVGNTVTGVYAYVPTQTTATTEGASVYRWYVSTDAAGTGKTVVTSATAKTYTIASPVGAGKYIAFGVTPVSADSKIGTEVLSSWVSVATQTTAYDGTVVNELVSPSGRVWMDRNLGANRVATSTTDYLAYGSLFQWCRPADGHEKINWTSATTGTPVNGATATLSSSTTPGHSLFIYNTTSPYDWLNTQQSNGNLWWSGSAVGANNPCPTGYHVPTYAEWNRELTYISNTVTAYSVLKLLQEGDRHGNTALMENVGSLGLYWSSSVTGTSAYNLTLTSSSAGMTGVYRASGFSVRCIKDLTAPDGTLVVDLVSPSGRTWMDRNLGASQQATSSTDYLAYGSFYQWSRPADGHQKVTWTSATAGTAVNGTTTTLSTTTTPGNSLFIVSSTDPYDWLSNQQSDGSLWWSGATAGANTPCPTGYHVPTSLEWSSEQVLFAGNGGNNATGAYNVLKLTLGGLRSYIDGTFYLPGSIGHYWSGSRQSGLAVDLYVTTSNAYMNYNYRANGFSVRCIKDIPLPVTTTVVDLVSPSGRTWMDRNIGASRAASSSTDYQAYGSLFQWCRAADNHEKIVWTSATTGTPVYNTYSTLSSTTTPGHSLFIINTNSPYDWLSTQQTDGMLWWNGIVAGANSPCPIGYHVPTYAEWNTELALFASNGGANSTGAYNVLKLNLVGGRVYTTGSLNGGTGTTGCYWSSTVSGTLTWNLAFDVSSSASLVSNPRGYGLSVRCIKNQTDIPKAQGVSVTGSVMMGATLTGVYTYVPPQISGTAEGTSTYKWYVATDATGTGSTAISGATAKTYTVASPVATGKYVAFGVTPVSSDGKIGSEVISVWVLITPDGTLAVDITSPSGRIWMDRNLGATQAAISSTDYLAYGSLYQWCRAADGHQKITWTSSTAGTAVNGTTATLSSSTTPGHSLFILQANSPYDWLSTPQSDGSLWWNGSAAGANNPCASGYHVPTYAEWNTELTYITNPTTAYSTLKLPLPGFRFSADGTFGGTGSYAYYRCSTVGGSQAYVMYLDPSSVSLYSDRRARGFSVRCIKN